MSDTGSGYVWPIAGQTRDKATITNRFGATQVRSAGWKGNLPPTNNGVDIAAASGTPIVAPASGRVVEIRTAATDSTGWGNSIVIEDSTGRRHRLSHMMEPPALKVGATVQAGQPVGRVGATGNATGPHLDYELRTGGQPQDALSLVFGGVQRLGDRLAAATVGGTARAAAPETQAPQAGAAPMASDTGDITDIYDPTLREAKNPLGLPPRVSEGVPQPGESRELAEARRRLAELESNREFLQRQYDGLTAGDPVAGALLPEAQSIQRDIRAVEGQITTQRQALNKLLGGPTATTGNPLEPKGYKTTKKEVLADGNTYITTHIADGMGNWEPDPETPPVPYGPQKPAPATAATRPQVINTDPNEEFIAIQQPDGTITYERSRNYKPPEAPLPGEATAGGRIIGYDRRTGTPIYTLDTRTPEEIELARKVADNNLENIRLATEYRDALTAALALPEGPEKNKAVEEAWRRYEMYSGPAGMTRLRELAEREVDRKQRQANDLGTQTGIVYDWETMQPKIDPITGAFMKTAAQVERERTAEVQRVQAQRALETAAIQQQTADETGRHNIESELTARGTQRSTALRDIASAAGLGTGREVWTPATAAARVASQSQVLDRNGIANVGRSLGLDENMLNSVLSGYDSFQQQQQQLRSQIQPVRRAPDVGAAPAAPAVPPVGAGVGAGPGSPTVPAPPPSPITVSPLDVEPPIAAAAALVPPPPLGEPETVMIPRAASVPTAGVPSTLDELLRQLNMMPVGWDFGYR